jgi:TolA-binding protein
MKKLILFAFLFLAFALPVAAQNDVCISQEDANLCAKRALEAKALREQVATLETAREADKVSIEELKNRINQLTVEAARLNGQLTEADKNQASQRAIIEFLLKHGRIKKYGIINF